MQLSRRGLITGLASFLAAPAIVRAGSLMPVKAWAGPDCDAIIEAFWANPGRTALIYRQELVRAFEALERWPRPVVTQDVIVQVSDAWFEIIPR